MNLPERLLQLASALPSERSTVTLTRADLFDLLGGATETQIPLRSRDLTVEEVAKETQRAPSTVRGWLINKALDGYKLNGRDWRVPQAALRGYLERQQQREPETPTHDAGVGVDITDWRRGVS